MSSYADVAVQAVLTLQRRQSITPRDAWNAAAAEKMPLSPSSQDKGCPRTTFLALCASGALEGVPAMGKLRLTANVEHANDCLALLLRHPEYLALSPRRLWSIVTHDSGKSYNSQMHVVLGLANAGMLRLSNRSSG